ncbi:hypothetical protein GSI_00586 [Ganoderma sinense ZZ0214-1]|uniref:Uncharacterized protein n=1 Tax=Ganoderma sinense ZZ0214-1 TaxID=1077348 RepID=A0A2G8ST02_9APHY|nr:hypothetical protein GSI_00586 [Ganoderma sinense ZZ0214-1]
MPHNICDAPVFENPLLDDKTVVGPSWLKDYKMKRVRVVAETGYILHNATNIDRVPLESDWGMLEHKNRLCMKGTPLTVAFIGECRAHDVDTSEDRVPLLHVTVDLMRDCDKEGWYSLTSKFAPWKPVDIASITAFRKLRAIAPVLPPVLDGTRISIPNAMPRSDWDHVRCGDILLLECTFKRSMLESMWTARFVIERATIIAKRPSAVPV